MSIRYSDSETRVFHPVCERALNSALVHLKKQADYEVVHELVVSTLRPDFLIRNVTTKRVLCVVEVKRKPEDVRSVSYHYQARKYVLELTDSLEQPFYVLTNLETACAFRLDNSRPKAYEQVLQPGVEQLSSFSLDSENEVERKLSLYFQGILRNFLRNSYRYEEVLSNFVKQVELWEKTGKEREWRSGLALTLHEHIRGAIDVKGSKRHLRDAKAFRGQVELLCNEAVQLNFRDIFSYSSTEFLDRLRVDSALLSSMHRIGKQDVQGTLVDGLIHEVTARAGVLGEVATDPELSTLVALFAKHIHGGMIGRKGNLCDPAAGSGNLLSAAIDVFGPTPGQVIANDIQPKFRQLLSHRLGLKFLSSLEPSNSPKITISDVADLPGNYLNSTEVIVMNPPYLSGVQSVREKKGLYARIRRLTGAAALTERGQMPLEGPFLELITLLARPGTTIACVLPKTHLMARGVEAQALRELFLDLIGLHVVFTYPGIGLFKDVVKDTVVLIGKVRRPASQVRFINSYDRLADLDVAELENTLAVPLSSNSLQFMSGVSGRQVALGELRLKSKDGWRLFSPEFAEAQTLLDSWISRPTSCAVQLLRGSGIKIRRGRSLNAGGAPLLVWEHSSRVGVSFKTRTVDTRALRQNAFSDSFLDYQGDSQMLFSTGHNAKLLEEIVDAHMACPLKEQASQPRYRKTKDELLKLLETEKRYVEPVSRVLIPRNLRRTGRIYLTKAEMFISSNFFCVLEENPDQALLLGTWMTTVFYQLSCELSSKDQEGTRKMEKADIENTIVPSLTDLPSDLLDKLRREAASIQFLNLQAPVPRRVDKIWAEALFGDNAAAYLADATKLLALLANQRYDPMNT